MRCIAGDNDEKELVDFKNDQDIDNDGNENKDEMVMHQIDSNEVNVDDIKIENEDDLIEEKSIPPKPSIGYKPPIISIMIRICTVSVLLSIGYFVNFISILHEYVIYGKQFEIWSLIYLISSVWLCIWCFIMIIMTLFGIKIKMFFLYHRQIAIYLFLVGIFCNIISLLLALFGNNENICLHFELLYSLQSIYLSYLIYCFDYKHYCG